LAFRVGAETIENCRNRQRVIPSIFSGMQDSSSLFGFWIQRHRRSNFTSDLKIQLDFFAINV